jgi:hypothetical protein
VEALKCLLFEGARPNIQVLLQSVAKESNLWSMVGASALPLHEPLDVDGRVERI